VQDVEDLDESASQVAASLAARDMRLQLRVENGIEGAVEVIGEQLLRPPARKRVVPHDRATSRRADRRRRASSRRPRLMRLFTVPSGMSRMDAISS
jgi:hypothetical protein